MKVRKSSLKKASTINLLTAKPTIQEMAKWTEMILNRKSESSIQDVEERLNLLLAGWGMEDSRNAWIKRCKWIELGAILHEMAMGEESELTIPSALSIQMARFNIRFDNN